jgi:hypothetical protein
MKKKAPVLLLLVIVCAAFAAASAPAWLPLVLSRQAHRRLYDAGLPGPPPR